LSFNAKDRTEMSAAAQTMLRDYAAFRWPTLNHKGRMGNLARVLNLTFRRVRSLYQNEPGVSLRADEMAAIEALRNAKAEEANKHEFQALEARLARLEAALFQQDEDFYRGQMAALRSAADGRRGHDEPRAADADRPHTDTMEG
jgi:hypothetical protein